MLRKNSECASRRGHGIKHGKVLEPEQIALDICRANCRFRAEIAVEANAFRGVIHFQADETMAKATTIKIRLQSTADTGYFYVTKKNSRTMTEKMVKTKYDPVVKKHVEFREAKIK